MERVLSFDDEAYRTEKAHCCTAMTEAVTYRCPQHPDPFDCGDSVVYYSAMFNEYGLIIYDGGASYLLIPHCPWCGTALPASRRDDWFEALEQQGFSNPLGDEIPKAFQTDAWYNPQRKVQ